MKSIIVAAGAAVALGLAVPLAQAAGGPTDAQIAAIVVTANQVDIDAGKLAKSKGHAPEVKEFAERMITNHPGANRATTVPVTTLNVPP